MNNEKSITDYSQHFTTGRYVVRGVDANNWEFEYSTLAYNWMDALWQMRNWGAYARPYLQCEIAAKFERCGFVDVQELREASWGHGLDVTYWPMKEDK